MKITKRNLVKVLTQIQDDGDYIANSIATDAIQDFGLTEEHENYQKELLGKNRKKASKYN